MSNIELSEQEIIRRNSLQKLRELGINPYPADEFKTNATVKQIIENYNPESGNFQDVVFAGRLMSQRIMGKASFGELQDETGRIQIYVNRDEICPAEDKTLYNDVFKKLLDIGDIIGCIKELSKSEKLKNIEKYKKDNSALVNYLDHWLKS